MIVVIGVVYQTNLRTISPGLRDYQDCKADVIQKYFADEARNLKAYGELPASAKLTCDTVSLIFATIKSRFL